MDNDCRYCTGIARMRATLAPLRGRSGSITSVPVCCLDEAARLSALAQETGRIMTLHRTGNVLTPAEAAWMVGATPCGCDMGDVHSSHCPE